MYNKYEANLRARLKLTEGTLEAVLKKHFGTLMKVSELFWEKEYSQGVTSEVGAAENVLTRLANKVDVAQVGDLSVECITQPPESSKMKDVISIRIYSSYDNSFDCTYPMTGTQYKKICCSA